MIDVKIDEQSYKDLQGTLRRLRQDLPKAAVSTMSKSLTQVKKILVDETAAVINLTKSRITEDITTEVSGDISGSNLDNFKIIMRSKGKPVGLIYFATPKDWAWQNPVPIKVKIYKSGTSHKFTGAFIAKGSGASKSSDGSTKLHLWQRADHYGKAYKPGRKYHKLPHEYRFPLERLTTVRIQDIQGKPEFSGKILEAGAQIIIKDLDGAINEVLNG